MSGALIQLVSKGMQDIYITSDEGTSFFRTKFSRHTNFSQAPKFIKSITNQDNSITIPVYGDALNGLWFQGTGEANISSNLFYNSTIDLYIGGQKVDSQHYDYYSDIWPNYLPTTYPKSQEISTKVNTSNLKFVPLHFFFCDGGTVLPLVALQHHAVEIRVNFDDTHYNEIGLTPNQKKISLYGNYIYLDKDEREGLLDRQIDMIVTQTQRFETPVNFTSGNYNTVDLSQFNHPVKSIFFGISAKDPDFVNDRFSFDTCDIQLNGTALLESMEPMYFHTIQNYYKSTLGQIYFDPTNNALIYTRYFAFHFGLNANDYTPNGTCNFSRLDNAKLIIRNAVKGINRNDTHINIFGVNYNILRIKNGMAGILFGN